MIKIVRSTSLRTMVSVAESIVVASGKGGVGKSMLASSLAILFSQKKKVIAVDCDVDAPNLHLWLGENEKWDEIKKISTSERPIIDKTKCNLCGQCVGVCAFNALSIDHQSLVVNRFFCEGCGACEEICPQGAIKMVPVKNAEIRIKKNVHGFPLVSAQLYPGETGSGKVVDAIKNRGENFFSEIMILDAPAGTGCPVIAAVKDANLAVLVTEPTPSALADLERVLAVVNYFHIPWGLVINKWDINSRFTKKVEKKYQKQLLGKISYDQKIFRSIANLMPIMETDLKAKEEIKTIYYRLLGKINF